MRHTLLHCVLASLLLAPPARAQDRARELFPVRVQGLFGDETIASESYAPLLVTLENRTAEDVHGTVELRVHGSANELEVHTAEIDLPSRTTRQVTLTPYLDAGSLNVEARFVVDGRAMSRGYADVGYAAGARSIVIVADPPRLHSALIGLQMSESTTTGPREVQPPIGVAQMDRASGDPMLPADAFAWSSVKVLVASAPVLLRAGEAERAAIVDWVRAGGLLVVFPRDATDLRERWLTAIAGPVGVEPSTATPALVPSTVERFTLSCSQRQRTESFGCSAPVGLGRVFLAGYDGLAQRAIDAGAPGALVQAVYEAPDEYPNLSFGRGHDSLTSDYYAPEGSFGTLRVALDPNEGFRPALILVALVLLLYVIVVGPLNFRWVQRKNRPTLALLTTPLVALICMLALLAVGYVGKGVSMRFRRCELVELVEGQRRGPARRYTGLFSTRPGSFDLSAPRAGTAVHRVEDGGERGPVHRHEGARVRLADCRAGLWETTFVREDRMVDLRGTIRFERDGARVAEVVNDSPHALTGAFLVASDRSVFAVGDIPPHGSAPVSRTAVVTGSAYYYEDETQLARALPALHIPHEEEPYVLGIARLTGGFANAQVFVPPDFNTPVESAYVLYARAALEPRSLGVFSSEADYRWIRVFASSRGAPITEMPRETPENEWSVPQDPPAPTEQGDAGVTP